MEKTNAVLKGSGEVVVRASYEDFGKAQACVAAGMKRNGISGEIISETMLVFEALFHNLLEQGFGAETALRIRVRRSFSDLSIRIGFEGAMFVPIRDGGGSSPEDRILLAYEDKVDCSYHTGYNLVRITVRRGFRKTFLFCMLGILAAAAVSLLIRLLGGESGGEAVARNVVFPMERLFTNAMLMMSAPVTFLSLLKNLSDVYIVSVKHSNARRLWTFSLITSAVAVALAVVTSLLPGAFLRGMAAAGGVQASSGVGLSLGEILSTMVPESIFVPFETISPFPLIIVALLVTYALCSVGKYFDRMKKVIDAGYTLFSRMLGVIMFALPFFCFLAVLEVLLRSGPRGLLTVVLPLALTLAGLAVLLLFYLIRLLAARVPLRPFLRKLPGLIVENYRIGSAIDAVPFNIRYCTRNYGMNRKRLEESLPILAQINLDGNCFLIMLSALLFIATAGVRISVYETVVIAVLVVFLSMGAPNQPGSCVIGMLIIINYLGAGELLSIAIYLEVFFGSLQNLTNVLGDIVTAAIEERKAAYGSA